MKQPLMQSAKSNILKILMSKRGSFVVGISAAFALVLGLGFSHQLFSDRVATPPHTAELEYATESLAREAGASVIPASCDSGVEHWSGDLAGCQPGGVAEQPYGYHDYASCNAGGGTIHGWTCDPNNYNAAVTVHIYQDGPAGSGTFLGSMVAGEYRADIGGSGNCGGTSNHAYSYTIPQNLRDGASHSYYVYALDDNTGGNAGNPLLTNSPMAAVCPVPPPLAAPTGLTYSCGAGGTSANVFWNPVAGASRYLPRLSVVTPAQCAANGPGWAMAADGLTCYHDTWGSTGASLTINPGTDHSFWIYSGDPLSPYSALALNCPANTIGAPSSITTSCAPTGDSVRVAWTPPATGPAPTKYYVNIGGLTQTYCSSIGYSWNTTDNYTCYNHNLLPSSGTARDLAITPGNTYNVSVYAGDPVATGWPGVFTGSFSCPAPPPPPPAIPVPTVNITATHGATTSGTTLNCTTGQNVTINWTSTNATNCNATGGPGFDTAGAANGTDSTITEPYGGNLSTYSVSCTGPGGTVTDSVGVNNTTVTPPPATIDLGVRTSIIRSGTAANLTWSITAGYNMQCSLTGEGRTLSTLTHTTPIGTNLTTTGNINTGILTSSQVYTMTCVDTSSSGIGNRSDGARVDVTPFVQEI